MALSNGFRGPCMQLGWTHTEAKTNGQILSCKMPTHIKWCMQAPSTKLIVPCVFLRLRGDWHCIDKQNVMHYIIEEESRLILWPLIFCSCSTCTYFSPKHNSLQSFYARLQRHRYTSSQVFKVCQPAAIEINNNSSVTTSIQHKDSLNPTPPPPPPPLASIKTLSAHRGDFSLSAI